jgi:predicted transposase YbfD/YdcC
MVEQVVQRVLQVHPQDEKRLEPIILDTLYEEHQRLEKEKNLTDKSFYRKIQTKLLRKSPHYGEIFPSIIRNFAEEIHGHFSPLAYQAATKIVPIGLNLLLKTLSPLAFLKKFSLELSSLDKHVLISGETEQLQILAKKGTIILFKAIMFTQSWSEKGTNYSIIIEI